jgi:hypothetical protein
MAAMSEQPHATLDLVSLVREIERAGRCTNRIRALIIGGIAMLAYWGTACVTEPDHRPLRVEVLLFWGALAGNAIGPAVGFPLAALYRSWRTSQLRRRLPATTEAETAMLLATLQTSRVGDAPKIAESLLAAAGSLPIPSGGGPDQRESLPLPGSGPEVTIGRE